MRYQIPVIVVIVALVGLLGFMINDLYFADGLGAKKRSRSVAVRLAPVEQKTIVESYEAVGTSRAQISIFIKARHTVHIDQMFIRDNSFVKKGDLLLTLDSSVERALLEEAEVNLAENTRLFNHYNKLAKKNAVSKTKLAEQRALVKASEAKVHAAKARVDDLEIRASYDGRIGTWQASPGALVTKERIINNLDDTQIIKVDFTIPETYMGVVDKDLQFIAKSPAYPDREFIGELDHIKTRIDEVTRAATVRLNVPNEDGALKPGMLLKLTLIKSKTDAITVPERALVPVNDKQYIFVVSEDNKAIRKEVQIGRRRPGVVEIIDGVQLGDQVVVEGAFKLKPGFPVKVLASREAPKKPGSQKTAMQTRTATAE